MNYELGDKMNLKEELLERYDYNKYKEEVEKKRG